MARLLLLLLFGAVLGEIWKASPVVGVNAFGLVFGIIGAFSGGWLLGRWCGKRKACNMPKRSKWEDYDAHNH